MAKSLLRFPRDERNEEGEEPPPDWLAECDSDETIKAVQQALQRYHQVILIESDEQAYLKLLAERPDLVFNIAERLSGPNRESHVPTICEILNIPYTGSDPLTLGICLDKSRAKEILSYYGIPTPKFWVLEEKEEIPADISFPAIVKPLYEGSSKGIKNNSVVNNRKQLRSRIAEIKKLYNQPAIVEKFLPGREFTVGVLGNYPDLEILPVVEIDYRELPAGANPIYSYEAKWVWDTPEKPLQIFSCPAELSAEIKAKIENLVRETCRILRIRDWARIDLRLDENGEPNIIEINPLPGILPKPEDNSCLPKAARAAGYTYDQLINRVVYEASKRYGLVLDVVESHPRAIFNPAKSGGTYGS
ncbi:MAG TPA: ATP-grasp domain-containing protein [Candidatus Aminicenantes bacterium]|nr:MAG: D-alanine--D-alanine ligase [Candidatus Aminicenantes bacterium]HEK85398.1 ATP-grasp domain-containing protein [Candidatus Aminicenantes bacterium]